MLVCKFLLKTSVRNSLRFRPRIPIRRSSTMSPSPHCAFTGISFVWEKCDIGSRYSRVEKAFKDYDIRWGASDIGWDEELVDWFFDVILNDFDSEERTRLLIFWIGVAVVPAAGFGEIFPPITLSIASWCADSGVNNLHAPTRTSSSTELQHQSAESSAAGSSSSSSSSSSTNHQGRRRHVTSSSDKSALLRNESLPQSHVCFNRLDLPFYHSREQLSLKLRKAVQLCGNAVSIE